MARTKRPETRKKATWGGQERRRSMLVPHFKATAHELRLATRGRREGDAPGMPAQPAPAAPSAPVAAAPAPLSKGLQQQLTQLRQPFLTFTSQFAAMTQTRASLAPRFMKTFDAWTVETGGTFVAFVRVLDPGVPEDREGYRAHPSYQAADYLRRLTAEADRPEEDTGTRAATPLAVIASLLASIVPVVDNMDAVYTIFEEKLHWTPGRIDSLRKLVAESPPLLMKSGQERKLRVAA